MYHFQEECSILNTEDSLLLFYEGSSDFKILVTFGNHDLFTARLLQEVLVLSCSSWDWVERQIRGERGQKRRRWRHQLCFSCWCYLYILSGSFSTNMRENCPVLKWNLQAVLSVSDLKCQPPPLRFSWSSILQESPALFFSLFSKTLLNFLVIREMQVKTKMIKM